MWQACLPHSAFDNLYLFPSCYSICSFPRGTVPIGVFLLASKEHIMANNPNRGNHNPKKAPILGQSHSLSDIEGEMIQHMIREEQHSARELYIPQEDLALEATTEMSPEAAQVIADSKVRTILQ